MKFVVTINQRRAAKLGDIDLIDCVLLDWLFVFCNSRNPRVKSERKNNKSWVSYSHVMADLPLLGIKSKSAISQRLQLLGKKRYLEIETDGQKTYIDITVKAESLFRSDDETVGKSPKTVHKPFFQTNRPFSQTNGTVLLDEPISTTNISTTKSLGILEKNGEEKTTERFGLSGYELAKSRIDFIRQKPNIPFEQFIKQRNKLALIGG